MTNENSVNDIETNVVQVDKRNMEPCNGLRNGIKPSSSQYSRKGTKQSAQTIEELRC